MATIPGPKTELAVDDPDRSLDCQEAIEDAFAEIAEQAVDAGWGVDEVLAAMLQLAACRVKAAYENSKTSTAVAEARRKLN